MTVTWPRSLAGTRNQNQIPKPKLRVEDLWSTCCGTVTIAAAIAIAHAAACEDVGGTEGGLHDLTGCSKQDHLSEPCMVPVSCSQAQAGLEGVEESMYEELRSTLTMEVNSRLHVG